MKQLVFPFLSIVLVSCSEDTIKDINIFKKDSETVDKTELVEIEKEDTTNYPENVSPDGSWEVLVNNQEGFFIGYTINYKDGSKSISKKVNQEIEIIGGMDHPGPKWLDVKTYQIPNIGGTSKGHYELRIYKDGSCKYIEHIATEEELIDAETEISQSSPEENKEPIIDNTYSQNENFIVFRQDIKSFGDKNVGCSSSESSLSMVIQNVTDSFELINEELVAVKLNYNYSGGLYDYTGEKPFKGYIKGKLIDDNTWKIEVDVWITTFSYVDNEKSKRQIKTSGIFNP